MAQFAPLAPNRGFDSAGPWQSAVKGEYTYINLTGGPKHALSLSDPTVAEIGADEVASDGSRVISIKGLKVDETTTLVAKDPKSSAPLPSDAKLEIGVLQRATIRVRFFRITDSSGRQPNRALASMAQALLEASAIHSPQDGVRLEFGGTEELSVGIDLGPVAETAKVFDHLRDVFASRRPDSCQITFNVFLIKAVESKTENIHRGRNVTLASTRGDMCLFEDGPFAAGRVLAHEFGHFLLPASLPKDGHHPLLSNLMFEFEQPGSGSNLDKSQCQTMNRSARDGSRLHPSCVLPPPPGL